MLWLPSEHSQPSTNTNSSRNLSERKRRGGGGKSSQADIETSVICQMGCISVGLTAFCILGRLRIKGTGFDAEIVTEASFTHVSGNADATTCCCPVDLFCCYCYTGCWFLISSAADLVVYHLIILPPSLQTSVFP